MDDFTLLFIVAGVVFVAMALGGSILKRLPLSSSLIYLAAGVLIGPRVLDLIDLDATRNAALLERLTEVAVVVSLFTAGLKLRVDWRDALWHVPARLATISMLVTVGLVTLAAVGLLGLSTGAAVLLGAMLSPTDPVLASDVQVEDATDLDVVRFGLTGEAGLNDGTAFPFVMLGLGIIGHHDLGTSGIRWFAVDLLWAGAAGLATGAILGTVIGHLVLIMRKRYRRALGLHEFLTLGLIAISYGIALSINSYGFLAVFAAGLALGRIERQTTSRKLDAQRLQTLAAMGVDLPVATHRATASSYLVSEIQRFNEQIERIGEVAIVVVVGILLSHHGLEWEALWFVPLLLLLIRPVAVRLGLFGLRIDEARTWMISWFGIRGIGSLYYLTFAIVHGLGGSDADTITQLVLTTITVSILVHGVSVTPLMRRYEERGRLPVAGSPEIAS